MKIEVTQEEARRSVIAAFDSVNLINQINTQTEKSQEDLDSVERNIGHLKIMMAKDWFVAEATAEEKTQIETVIA